MSKEDVKNEGTVIEEATAEEMETRKNVTEPEQPKVSKLTVAKVFVKTYWKPLAFGAASLVAIAAIKALATDKEEEPIEGDYTELDDEA